MSLDKSSSRILFTPESSTFCYWHFGWFWVVKKRVKGVEFSLKEVITYKTEILPIWFIIIIQGLSAGSVMSMGSKFLESEILENFSISSFIEAAWNKDGNACSAVLFAWKLTCKDWRRQNNFAGLETFFENLITEFYFNIFRLEPADQRAAY